MILYALAAAMASPFLAPAHAIAQAEPQSAYTQAQAEKDLRTTIATFGEAIIRKDARGFLALFAEGPVTWRRVNSDARLARLGEQATKAAFDPANTPRDFIERIVSSPHRHEETFSNISIAHDEDVAAITFNFTYLLNGRAINQGKESWHLVRTAQGWRIVSVIYSNNDPAG